MTIKHVEDDNDNKDRPMISDKLLSTLYRQRRLLLCIAIGLAANTLIGLFFFAEAQRQQKDSHARDYATSLAKQVARQTADPLLNQDLVSLQVILKSVAQHPRVLGATVHDVEDQLLVQGGHLPQSGDKRTRQSHSAPITLHDSMAGYVTITLQDTSDDTGPQAPLFWSWLALFIATAAAVLFFTESEENANRQQPAPATTQDGGPDEVTREAKAQEQAANPSTPEIVNRSERVQLAIQIHNFAQLRDQLNRGSFKTLLSRLDQQLQGVQSLYSGSLEQPPLGRPASGAVELAMNYSGTNREDCLFRALCSAQLLLSLTSQAQGPQLLLSARTSLSEPPADQDQSLSDLLLKSSHQPPQAKPHQVYIAPELLSSSLEKQVDYTTIAGTGWVQLQQIKPPYSELLAKQQQQLHAL